MPWVILTPHSIVRTPAFSVTEVSHRRKSMYDLKPWLTHYETAVPESIQYDGQLLHHTLDTAAQKYPNNVAVRFLLKYLPLGIAIQSKLTYRELKDATDRFATALRNLGI